MSCGVIMMTKGGVVMISQDKKDRIYNALIIGMTLEDAYVYAGLTPDEMVAVGEDIFLQSQWKQLTKELEVSLLTNMKVVADKQVKLGKSDATEWMLEHLFPRYSGKPKDNGGEIHIHLSDKDPADLDTVEISKGK